MVFELPGSTSTGKVGYETMQRIGAINTRALTRLSEVQAELASFGITSTLEQTRLLTDMDRYSSLVAIESDLAEKYCNRLVEMTNKTTSLMLQSGDEMMALVEEMFDARSVKTPVAKAAAPATKTVAKPKKKTVSKKTTATSRGPAKRKTSKKAG